MDVCSLATGHVDSSATTAMAPLSTHPKSLASLTHIAGVYSPWWVKIQIIKFKLRADNLLYFLRYRELILRPLPLSSSDILKCPSNNIIGFRLPLMQSIQVSSLLTSFLQSTSIYSKYIKSFSHRSAHKPSQTCYSANGQVHWLTWFGNVTGSTMLLLDEILRHFSPCAKETLSFREWCSWQMQSPACKIKIFALLLSLAKSWPSTFKSHRFSSIAA